MEDKNWISFDLSIVKGLIGLPCCRQRLGRLGLLTLGFGRKIPHGRKKRGSRPANYEVTKVKLKNE